MMADLPHVIYNPKNKSTREQEENRVIIARHEREQIKKVGLQGLKLNLNFKKGNVIDGNSLLDEINN